MKEQVDKIKNSMKATSATQLRITRWGTIINFKMKYEAKKNCKNTIERFGKRRIGWHKCTLL